MLLAIDVGNTNTVFAVWDLEGGHMRAFWRSSTHTGRTADEYAVWLTQLMALDGLRPSDIEAVIISNVVPATRHSLGRLALRYFDCEAVEVGAPGVKLDLEVRVDYPEEVGADRLVNAVAAIDRYGGPLVIIDFGTATTFDVVSHDRAHCGGVIAPGIHLSLEALHRAAAQLPRVAIARPRRVIGKGTVQAILSGTYWGYVGLVEGLARRIAAEFEEEYGVGPMTVIATGGLAPLFAESTDVIQHVDQDLTLRGLVDIYRRNRRP